MNVLLIPKSFASWKKMPGRKNLLLENKEEVELSLERRFQSRKTRKSVSKIP